MHTLFFEFNVYRELFVYSEIEFMLEERKALPMEAAIRYLLFLGLGTLACACLL